TAATKSLTTARLTSASSSARRISRAVSSMSASVIRPLPRRLLNVAARRSCRVSNTTYSSRVRQLGGARLSLLNGSDDPLVQPQDVTSLHHQDDSMMRREVGWGLCVRP